jgi:uncharacterized protein
LSPDANRFWKHFAQDLSRQYTIEVQVLDADMSSQQDVNLVIETSKKLDVGLVVVNAGFGTSGLFISSSIETEINMLEVNCKALLSLTHHFAKRFAAQRRGGIILMSSIVGFQGVPNAATYAATKGYVQSLGEAIALELKPKGVDVLVAAPGPVETGFSERSDMKMGNVLKPEDVGVPILKALGRTDTVLPGTLTKVLVCALRTLPRWGKVRIMSLVMGGMTSHQHRG